MTTLKDIKDRALDYADLTGTTAYSDARLSDYVNDGLAILHDLLIDSHMNYKREESTITLVAGTEKYALPEDFYKCIKVWYENSDRRFRVGEFNLDEIDGYKTSPISSGTVKLWYAPRFKRLTSDNQKIDITIIDGWEDFAALHAAIRLLIREESDTTALTRERETARQRIIQMCSPRDVGGHKVVGDYYDRYGTQRQILRFDDRYFKYMILGNYIHVIEVEYLGV